MSLIWPPKEGFEPFRLNYDSMVYVVKLKKKALARQRSASIFKMNKNAHEHIPFPDEILLKIFPLHGFSPCAKYA